MKIAVFDKNPIDRMHLCSLISEWSMRNSLPEISIQEFSSINELTLIWDGLKRFQVLLLSIETAEEHDSLFLFAKKLKNFFPSINIILISRSSDHISDAFLIPAFRFLLKPINNEKLAEALDALISDPSYFRYNSVLLHGEEKDCIIPVDQILFMDSYSRLHQIVLHLTDGEKLIVKFYGSISEYIKKTFPQEFVQSARGVIVNINYIKDYSHSTIHLKAGKCETDVPVGKAYYHTFVQSLETYIHGS